MLCQASTDLGVMLFSHLVCSSMQLTVLMCRRILLVFTGIFTFLVDAYPLYAASALASNAFVRCMFAAAFPLFGTQMYNKLGYSWASSLLAFLTVAMLPFPYIFFKYGKKIRSRSRFATQA
ncbi:hypothetical protein BDP81DRAFT_56910 [Colletotrichum phormii]|uniref:Uncharacterized protein n=1 Tax=Colletotrichum phormii TaxID=359342 RepID=A0AAI9ZLP9_9PEZI|nr:uncharacterized protein BDP81DRAFT_56910 [Colletotrichum phormii]KAK1634302.1 hypothetical protein BDP81DRAFT_56910 [Colletotrichum phormii]